MNGNNRKIKLPNFSYLLLIYIILAAGWWTILLFRLNRQSHEAQLKLYHLEQQIKNPGIDGPPENIEEVTAQFRRKKNMIAGETIFFLISIVAGAILIHRANRERIDLARRQRNFILAVTHELKTPLTAIQMVLETFIRRKPNEEQQKLLVNGAMEETQRLKYLVENLLTVARSGELKKEDGEPTDLHMHLQEIVQRYRQTFPNAKINYRPEAVKSIVKGSRDDIYQVFTNLFDNAFKYAGEHCSIGLSTQNADNDIVILFTDNGPGIPDEEKKNIFKLFYRIGTEEYHHKPGTGVGLYIVHTLVSRLQGTVSLEDQQPQGLAVRIIFKTI